MELFHFRLKNKFLAKFSAAFTFLLLFGSNQKAKQKLIFAKVTLAIINFYS